MATDYRTYRLNVKEILTCIVVYFSSCIIAAYLFYDSIIPCVVLSPGIVVAARSYARAKGKQRRKKLNMEFKEMLLSLAANMSAGYSLERAFVPLYNELNGIYQGKGYIQKEVGIIVKGLEVSADVETLLGNLADRSGVDDIKEFAEVVSVAKRSGGNLVSLMKSLAANIDARLEVEDEIDTMITAKRFEQNIMCVMPFLIVLYLRVGNPGYLDALYRNPFGVAAMSVCLMVICAVAAWGRKLIDIRV